MRNKLIIILAITILTITGCNAQSQTNNQQLKLADKNAIGQSNPNSSTQLNEKQSMKQYNKAPEMQIDEAKSYTATIKTDAGNIKVQLYANKTPITVNNFVFLAKDGFYDNAIFHRVINGFMIQGGDPTGTGRGGPGYKFADEPFKGEYKRGILAMANAGPDTNGSQFFIMHKDYPLPHNYVIFGEVIDGLDIVDKIATAKTGANDRPITPVKILGVEVEEK